MSIAESAITPLTGNVREFETVVPRTLLGERNFSDKLTDYVESLDDLQELQREERRDPNFYANLASAAIGSGLIGAGAGAAKGVLWDRGLGPSVAPAAAGLGAVGVGSALLYGILRKRLRNRLREASYKTLVSTPAYIRDIYRYPQLRKKVQEFANTRWLPYYGIEGGALAGGLGALAGGWATGADKSKNLALTVGGSIAGAGAGAVLGYLLRERRRKQLLRTIRDETIADPQ